MWISLAQVKLVDSTKNPEVIYATHDTSNIRAIGVSSNDNRFVGYTFKQDGKHLTCCVLWCHSAGLMVSLVSYLCQACQITFHQKGNSFHEDEVDGDNWEVNVSLLHTSQKYVCMYIVRIRMYVGPPSVVYKVSTISKTLGLKLGDHTNVMLTFQCHRDLCQQMITMGVLVGCCATSTSTQVHRKHLALHRPFPSHLPQVRTF